jgi:hypothetical protein
MPRSNRNNPGAGSGSPKYPGTFLLAFREAVAELGWQIRRWLGDAVECVDADGEEHIVGLENLFRRARREDRQSWPALISDFLSTVRAAEKNLGDAPVELAQVADRLLVRLGPPFSGLRDESRVWSQTLPGTDLHVNLVIDQPETMTYVTEPMIADSGRPGSAWLEQALSNLRARTPDDCFEQVHEESGLLLCCVGDAYDSSRALLVESVRTGEHPAGFLVAVPSRDELLVLPVEAQALPHLHLLKVLADKNYHSAPYPISNEVYWIHRGSWRRFPIEMRQDKVVIQPPEDFVALLNQVIPENESDAADESTSP